MKTLYLHIGTPKTATTAIQFFCGDNETLLNAKGYAYPRFGNHYRYISEWRNAHFLIGEKSGDSEQQDFEKRDQVVQECFEKIYKLFEEYDNIILSDEGLWNAGNWHDWRIIQNELKKEVFTVKVIVYLRRQDEFLYSRWNQQIKTAFESAYARYARSWDEMLANVPRQMVDYYGTLKKISEFVGKENITVRKFDRKEFFGGSIYADFLNIVGLKFTDEFKIQEDIRNVSLTKNDTEIKRILNGLSENNGKYNSFFRECLTTCSREYPDDNRYNMFSKQEMRKFLSKFQEGNQKIAKEYFDSKEPLFSSEYKAKEKWTPKNPAMFEDVIRFAGSMVIELLKQNQKLKVRLDNHRMEIRKAKERLENQRKEIRKLKERLDKLEKLQKRAAQKDSDTK